MIRLDGNSLAAFRGAGVAGTVQSVAGCELFGEARGTSPYSAAATRAIKQAYPDLWNTLKQFGFDNPDKVPFINQYPLVAPYLLADGLAFMVDCQYECTTSKWKDLVSAIEFASNGSVSLQSGVPYFNGSAWYNNANNLPYAYNTCTIEVVFTREKTGRANLLDNNSAGKIGFLFYSYYQGVGSNSQSSTRFVARDTLGAFTRVSIANTVGYQDGVAMTTQGTDYWGASSSGTTIGGGREKWQGKIYAIRIYNRLLTEQEILANQAIDLQRWQTA